ncbi:hypothetical protein P885DRAFT_82418 [Corynascus similis CBS 632.67]
MAIRIDDRIYARKHTSYRTHPGAMDSNITCYNCGKKGHYKRDCRSKKKDWKPVPGKETATTEQIKNVRFTEVAAASYTQDDLEAAMDYAGQYDYSDVDDEEGRNEGTSPDDDDTYGEYDHAVSTSLIVPRWDDETGREYEELLRAWDGPAPEDTLGFPPHEVWNPEWEYKYYGLYEGTPLEWATYWTRHEYTSPGVTTQQLREIGYRDKYKRFGADAARLNPRRRDHELYSKKERVPDAPIYSDSEGPLSAGEKLRKKRRKRVESRQRHVETLQLEGWLKDMSTIDAASQGEERDASIRQQDLGNGSGPSKGPDDL